MINIGLAQISATYLATRLLFISHPLQTFAVTNDRVALLPAQEICQHIRPVSRLPIKCDTKQNYDILLTVYLSIILVMNQLNAQILVLYEVHYMPLHVSSTLCSSSGGQNCIIQDLVSSHCRWPSRAQVENSSLNLCTGRPPTGVMIPVAV